MYVIFKSQNDGQGVLGRFFLLLLLALFFQGLRFALGDDLQRGFVSIVISAIVITPCLFFIAGRWKASIKPIVFSISAFINFIAFLSLFINVSFEDLPGWMAFVLFSIIAYSYQQMYALISKYFMWFMVSFNAIFILLPVTYEDFSERSLELFLSSFILVLLGVAIGLGCNYLSNNSVMIDLTNKISKLEAELKKVKAVYLSILAALKGYSYACTWGEIITTVKHFEDDEEEYTQFWIESKNGEVLIRYYNIVKPNLKKGDVVLVIGEVGGFWYKNRGTTFVLADKIEMLEVLTTEYPELLPNS